MDKAVKEEALSGAACLYLTDDYYSPLTQDLVQLSYFDEFYVSASPESSGTQAYLAACGSPDRVVIFVDTDEFWSSGFDAQALVEAFRASGGYGTARCLYAFGLSETWVVEK